jgi:hypothetical protein
MRQGASKAPKISSLLKCLLLRHQPDRRPAREWGLSQLPAGSDEMAGIARGLPYQVVLMLGLGLPKIARWSKLGHNLAGP